MPYHYPPQIKAEYASLYALLLNDKADEFIEKFNAQNINNTFMGLDWCEQIPPLGFAILHGNLNVVRKLLDFPDIDTTKIIDIDQEFNALGYALHFYNLGDEYEKSRYQKMILEILKKAPSLAHESVNRELSVTTAAKYNIVVDLIKKIFSFNNADSTHTKGILANGIADIYEKLNDDDQEIKWLKFAFEHNDPHGTWDYAAALRKNKRYAEAIDVLEKNYAMFLITYRRQDVISALMNFVTTNEIDFDNLNDRIDLAKKSHARHHAIISRYAS